MNFKLTLALLLVATVASSCAINPATETAPPEPKVPSRAKVESVPVEDSPGDETIGAEIRRRLVVQGPGDTAGIVIEVDDGTVTLRGVAPSQAAAWRAQSAALSVKGVKLVRNQIIVNTPNILP
jgi:osmotically-inducible protein OsmY